MRTSVLVFALALLISWAEASQYSKNKPRPSKKQSTSEDESFLILASTEGKMFGYVPKTNKILWAADLQIPLISSTHRVDLMEENHPIFVPNIEGDVGVFSYNDMNRYPMEEITSALQYCPLSKNSKVFSKTQDHAFFLNPLTGVFLPVSGGTFTNLSDKFDKENTLVVQVKSYLITAIDFVKMNEIWSVNSADLDLLTPDEYFAFRPDHSEEDKEHPKYFFLRKEQNVLEIYERDDWALVSTLAPADDKIFKVFAKNSTSKTYYSIQIKGRLDFVVKNDIPVVFEESSALALADWKAERQNQHALAVYNKKHSEYYCEGDQSVCDEQNNFKIVKKAEFQGLIECLDGIIQSRKERVFKEIELNRYALTHGSKYDEDDVDNEEDDEDDDKEEETEDDDEEESEDNKVEKEPIKKNKSDENQAMNPTTANESNKSQISSENSTEASNSTPNKPRLKHWMIIYGSLALIITILGLFLIIRRKNELTPPPLVKKKSLVVHSLGPEAEAMKVSSDSQELLQEKEKKVEKKNGRSANNVSEITQFIVDINENEILGHGSSGTIVFGGSFQNRPVAVKRVLRTHNALALKEIEILLQVDHPNIIKYLFYQEDKEFIYLVLERCLFTVGDLIEFWDSISKKNRKESRPTRRNIPPNVFAILGKPQARAVAKMHLLTEGLKGIEYLHSHNIIDRDLKPDNVLITNEGGIKLSDFAISKLLDDKKLEFLTENVGSGGWKAPEILLQKGEKTKAVDIFALGCLFYFIQSEGEHPFGEKFEREQNIIKGDMHLKLPEADYELEDLIKGMICFDPKQRYTVEQIKNHPVFWSVEKKLNYMQEFSNFIESMEEKLGTEFDEMVRLQNVIPGSWEKCLEFAIVKDVIKFRKYDFTSARDLIRVNTANYPP